MRAPVRVGAQAAISRSIMLGAMRGRFVEG
jgi:hypothetical protein